MESSAIKCPVFYRTYRLPQHARQFLRQVSGGLDDVYDRAKEECERQGQITLNTETYPAIEARGDLPEDHPQYLTDNQIESLKESEEDAMKARCRAEAEQKKREAEETAGSTEGFGGGETAAMGNAADNPQEANKKEGQITSENKAKAAGRADWPSRLGGHGTRYVPNARGWYVYPVRTVRGALGASRPAPPVRTQRGRLVRVAGTYPTEAPGRTRQLRPSRARSAAAALPRP